MIDLDFRDTESPIVFAQFTGISNPIDHSINVWDEVTLQHSAVIINVRVTESTGSQYKGEIFGFESSDDIDVECVMLGNIVSFSQDQIFCRIR